MGILQARWQVKKSLVSRGAAFRSIESIGVVEDISKVVDNPSRSLREMQPVTLNLGSGRKVDRRIPVKSKPTVAGRNGNRNLN